MSSAAVQQQSSPPQQQYAATAQHDRYPGNPAAQLASSPPSSRRRPDNNASLPNTPQHPQYAAHASTTSPRSPPNATSPGMSSSTYAQFYPDPAASSSIPARPSSQQTPTHAAAYDTRGYTSRPSRSQGQSGPGNDGDKRSPREDRGQRTRNVPTSSRSATAIGQPPMNTELPRENSAVINRIVVDDPQADLAREEARKAEARPHDAAAQMAAMSLQDAQDAAPAQRSRQEHLKHSASARKEVKFGDYILGQTIGEGEFGKVKMGWKKDSTVQVAIKLIRKESLAGNTTRLPKIYREISILRELQHPNIVRLHEFVETERHMGIILEYASGGELFDYILNHRYLKDPAARRLFAQLVSGVGYLHKKGIVHRDLKLENLLLDRNKHIIITDFGFANTFNPEDELGEELEGRITDKEFVKREGLDKIIPWGKGREGGHRRGDLMQTSCGSPCYAAPELVVSDGLYTGRKVDVWSCGVILYAMLAGYLPFDDDPANPEGDNINLLYKYIVSTPLTFPEYVTPHARDLLRRILVPDPRRRADLFEVARHSWLSEYTHVVGFIGSRVKSDKDIVATAMSGEEEPQLGRSASVREPTSKSPAADRSSMQVVPKHAAAASMGGDEASDFRNKQQRDAKRRTVQVEYVAPTAQTARGEPVGPKPIPMSAGSSTGRTRARAEGQGPVEVTPSQRQDMSMAPPSRPGRDQMRAASDSANAFGTSAGTTTSRPNTSGTFGGNTRLPSRGNSYSQPAAAQPTNTTAQGSFSQPKSSSGYIIAGQMSEPGTADSSGRPVSEQNRASNQYPPPSYPQGKTTGHRRSSTLTSIVDKALNRTNSKRQSQQESGGVTSEKRDRRYPPVSMKNAMPTGGDENVPRPSSDSRRPSFGFSRKASKERDSSVQGRRASRRFSWLPASFSMGNFAGKKDQGYESGDDGYRPPRDPYQQQPMSQQSHQSRMGSRPQSKGMAFGRGTSDTPSEETTGSTIPLYYEADRERAREQRRQQAQYDKSLPPSPGVQQALSGGQRQSSPPLVQRKQYRDDGYGSNRLDDSVQQQEPPERFYTPSQDPDMAGSSGQYNLGDHGQWQQYENAHGNLRPQQRKFGYEDRGHAGSSSATRRVMNFFRRRADKSDA